MIKISPSVLASDFSRLGEEAAKWRSAVRIICTLT